MKKNPPVGAVANRDGSPLAAAPTTELVKAAPAGAALLDMSPPQIAASFHKLTLVEETCTNLSGICSTLKGILLCEAKHKIEHGQFKGWLQKNFPKSYKTATRHMRLAVEFTKSDTSGTFGALKQNLGTALEILEANRLDLKNPVVAQVARWTKGRSTYQLFLDLGTSPTGGHHPRKGPPPTPEEAAKMAEVMSLAFWQPTIEELEIMGLKDKTWAHLPRAEMERLHGVCLDLSRAVGAALKNPEP